MKSKITEELNQERAKSEPLSVQDLHKLYDPVKDQIEERLAEFQHIWETASDEDLFRELVFCLLTPQSKARICWRAAERLE